MNIELKNAISYSVSHIQGRRGARRMAWLSNAYTSFFTTNLGAYLDGASFGSFSEDGKRKPWDPLYHWREYYDTR